MYQCKVLLSSEILGFKVHCSNKGEICRGQIGAATGDSAWRITGEVKATGRMEQSIKQHPDHEKALN